MAKVIVTGDGDALDLICYREYGVQAGAVERVLEVNPAIRDVAHRLPRGVQITLPDLANILPAGTTPRLWD
jgi:phage tail protein X